MKVSEAIEILESKVLRSEENLKHFPKESQGYAANEARIIAYNIAINKLEQIDEPQKGKVPEEFDEWYQQIKQQRGFSEMIARHFALWKICQFGFGHDFEDVSHERTPLDLSVWVSDHKDEAVHAILNGYEVEEEQLYVMPVPHVSFPVHYCVEDDHISFRQGNAQKFTQAELDKYFPDIKQFAVPVNEVVEG